MAELTLVLGASSDIGVALCRALLLASPEARILAHAFRSSERILTLVEEFPGRIDLLAADLSDEAATQELASHILTTYGAPSGVVHLPALPLQYERFTKFNWTQFERDLSLQVRSAVILLGKLLPKMSKLPSSRVVFMLSSVVHGVPPKFLSQYTMLKYMQLGMMRALAAEYGSTSLRINAVSPSMVETRFLAELSSHTVQGAAASHPLGRNATPEDVTGVIQFLLSPAAAYVSGVVVPVTGGSVL